MENSRDSKTEKEIVQDLKEVRESVKNDSSKKFDPDEVKSQIDDLADQVKGSDADSDSSIGEKSAETQKQEQNKRSDAGKD